MKKAILLFLLAGILIFSFACEKEDDEFVCKAPKNLEFKIDTDSTAILNWDASSDATRSDFMHYELMMASSSIKDGATPSDTFITTNLEFEVPIIHNQKKYFTVRTKLDNSEDSLSSYSNEINIAATHMGTVTLYQVNVADTLPAGMGFDDDGGHVYTMTPENMNNIYMYFGTENSDDTPGQKALKSPSLYSGEYHDGFFEELGFDPWKTYNTISRDVNEDEAIIEIGETVVLKTLSNNFVKLYIEDINSVSGTDYFSVVLRYSYQPILDYKCF